MPFDTGLRQRNEPGKSAQDDHGVAPAEPAHDGSGDVAPLPVLRDEHAMVLSLYRFIAEAAHPGCTACAALLPVLAGYLDAVAAVA